MDLKSMLNDKPPAEKKSSQSSPPPSAGGVAAPLQTSPPPTAQAQNGGYLAGYAPPRPTPGQGPGQQTPLYGPPSASMPPSQSRGLTPLHTPSQAGSGQYPFPPQQQPLQSPASAHPGQAQQYFSATTPGPRPSSHGYSSAHPQPSPSMVGYQQAVNAHHNSMSPTPSSHHSQTPSGIRQSPLAPGHQSAYQQPPHPSHYQHSQPNTPLGPPQIPQRHSNNSQLDVSSPIHYRSPSGASNGITAGSPAQHHPSIGNLVESPSLLHRPSPQTRRVSDHRSSASRERSVSVSPKTVPPPRPPSLGSRHSSQQEVYSARSSLQPGASVAAQSETPHHVQPHQTSSHAQPQASNTASGVAQVHSQTSGLLSGPPANANPLSHLDNRAPPQHSPQRMDMNHLLAPTQHAHPTLPNGDKFRTTPSGPSDSSQSQRNEPRTHGSLKTELQVPAQSSSFSAASHSEPNMPPTTTPAAPAQQHPRTNNSAGPTSTQQKMPLKRPAESDPAVEPPAKRGRGRRYTERPIWAHLAKDNPRAREPGAVPNSMQSARPQPQTNGGFNGANTGLPSAQSQANGQAQSNMPASNPDAVHQKPWQQNPPIDNDLLNARALLGAWEKSIKWSTPLTPFNRAITTWLWQNLDRNSDIGLDPREGIIEIEAKIGTLVDVDSGDRIQMPVQNACVIAPAYNRRMRFESEMNEIEHKNMNEFLNKATQESVASKGRQSIKYKHSRETDSFRNLSEEGMRALPEAAHRRKNQMRRDMKLRTSTDDKTGQVTARIVKVPIGEHLHIFGAEDPYDVRISMNLEVNLDRPGLDPNTLTEEASSDNPVAPNRRKDRLSYQHLAYHVDLTRVDVPGLPPKYELELEVDSNLLRKQIDRQKRNEASAVHDIVEGFVNNMTLLMRIQR
ncbi:mRNA-capping enzyme subunit beta [Lecanosticta acicola]|uniref:mRNA-capping enzyme subunit beta n=1 Tax=Lecanosticta acicola TaxID=111012 RepID=A0AAI8YUS4_9PEZI|nr:mRNA-capping enzyme subunit beta [Lecanosticta acicola]